MRVLASAFFVLSLSFATANAAETAKPEWILRAQAQLDSGDYPAAEATLTAALKNEPRSAEGHRLLARAALNLESYDMAARELHEARALGLDVDADEGVLALRQSRYQEAEPLLARAAAKPDASGDVWFSLGQARLGLNDNRGAAEAFRHAREREESLAGDASYFEGTALAATGDNDLAAERLQASIDADPESPTALLAADALAKLKPKKTLSFSLGLRGEYDTNVILAPTRLSLYQPLQVTKKAGARAVGTFAADWGPALSENWDGSLTYDLYQSRYLTNRKRLRNYDTTDHTLGLGSAYETDAQRLTLPLSLDLAYLGPLAAKSYHHYSSGYGFAPEYAYKIGDHELGLRDSFTIETYDNNQADVRIARTTYARSRNGVDNTLAGFFSYGFADGDGELKPEAGALQTKAFEANDVWNFSGVFASAALTVPLGEKFALHGSGEWQRRSYDLPFPERATQLRFTAKPHVDRELLGDGSLSYTSGAWSADVGLSADRNLSTIPLFDYQRWISSAGLTYTW